jgi:zinc protease
VDIGKEATTIRMTVLQDRLGKGLEALAEILTSPRFDETVVSAIKAQTLSALKRQGGDAQSVAMREAFKRRFPDHPYGRDPLLGLDTIPTLKREILVDFLKTYFTTPNMVVAVSGDLDKASARAQLTDFLGRLPHKAAPERDLPDPGAAAPSLVFIDKPGQVQSQVSLTLPGIPRRHPDYWPLGLTTQIFGGNDSLLYQRLRDDLGLVYSAWAGQTYRWQAGFIIGSMGCKGDQTVRAVEETVALMESMGREIPADKFALQQSDVLNSFVFNVDSPASLTTVYGRYFMRNEPLDTLDRIQDAYLNAQPEQLLPLAKTYLNPANLQVVVVADGDVMVSGLNSDGTPLRSALAQLAARLNLPFEEAPLL